MKKVLAIHYSQSGQLTEIMTNFTNGLEAVEVDFIRFSSKKTFPFPWTTPVFFDTMPETVLEIAPQPEELVFKHEKYDLIIIGYQPWFLSPSLPITGLLQDPAFKSRMKDTPVVTVIGARNMWLNAQESVKKLILEADGKLVGNIPLIDKTSNLISVVTILHWMLKGEKTRKWGIFPKPGVSDTEIAGVEKYGKLLSKHMDTETLSDYQTAVNQQNGVHINTNILFIEGRAKRLFVIWAKLILKKAENGGNRRFWVNFFKYYLIFALFVVSPILLILYNILVRPFTTASIKRKKAYFCGVELRH